MLKKQITGTLSSLLIILSFSNTAQADFELGSNYYKKGNHEKAFKEFLADAEFGDHDAQYNLGAMYYRGEFVKKDYIAAYTWMTLAAQNLEYKRDAAHTKIYNQLTSEQQKSAQDAYQTLAAKYSDAAIERRITPIFTGKSLAVKNQRVLKQVAPIFPSSMVRQRVSGFVDVNFTIDKYGFTRDHVVTYSPSFGFSRATVEALRQFQYEPTMVNGKAVDVNGFHHRMTYQVEGSNFNEKRITETVNDLRKKAQTGGNDEKLAFAYFLESIPSMNRDYKPTDNPNELYVNAANEGSGIASFFLGRNILYGRMCQQDPNQSMAWLLKAAKQGVADAQYMLALESFSGVQFEKNDEKGFYWLEKAAISSDAAKIRYAWILATHNNDEWRNGKRATAYLSHFDRNYMDKQSLYQAQAAVAAENGDFKQAVKWQKKALEDAQDLKLPTLRLEQQLASYNAKNPWREEI